MAESRTALIDLTEKKSSVNKLPDHDNQLKGNGNTSICRIKVPKESKPNAYNWIPERIRKKKIVFRLYPINTSLPICGLISERFSLLLHLKKNVPKYCSEHYPREDAQGSHLSHFLEY